MRISSVDCMRIVRNMLLNKRVLLILAKIDGKSSGNNRGKELGGTPYAV